MKQAKPWSEAVKSKKVGRGYRTKDAESVIHQGIERMREGEKKPEKYPELNVRFCHSEVSLWFGHIPGARR